MPRKWLLKLVMGIELRPSKRTIVRRNQIPLFHGVLSVYRVLREDKMRRSSASGHEFRTRALELSRMALMLAILCSVGGVPSWAQATSYRAGEKPQQAAANSSAKSLAELPPAALPAISAALGRDDAQYGARKTANGYSAENAPNHLAAQYAAKGVEIRSQHAHFGFEFQGWGYGDHPANKNKAGIAPRANANRVEYPRGALTEWYVNGPLGIEQGFTISRPPVPLPDSHHDALDIALRLHGNLSASVEPGRHALALRDQNGVPALRYGPLLAYDASGRELESWIEVQDSSVRLRVNTAGARYPIIIDPFVQIALLTNSAGAAGDEMGRSVAVSGNTVVVGDTVVNKSQGVVYVFVAPAGGWANMTAPTATLTASDGATGDALGVSVSINEGGNIVVAGAPLATVAGNVDQGAAYVFVAPPSGWASAPSEHEAVKLTASDGALGDEFGWGVGINEAGTTVVAGSFNAKVGSNKNQGAAYVFGASPLGWASVTSPQHETAKLTASDGAANDAFGYSVGISTGTATVDTVVVGSVDASAPTLRQGAIYVFVEPPTGGWVTTPSYAAKLTASDGTTNSYLGWSLAISGNTVVAGAYQTNVGSKAGQGAAYVFVEPTAAGGWASMPSENQTAELTASDGTAGGEFGNWAGISGSTAVVGSFQNEIYVFAPTSGWASVTSPMTETQHLTSGVANGFGTAVGISGNTIVASAYGATVGTHANQGAVYVFTQGAGTGAPIATTTTISSTSASFEGKTITGNNALISTTASPAPVTVYVEVQPATTGDATPTGGTVTVTDNFTPPDSCTGPVNNGVGSCPLDITQLGGGSTQLNATYSPAPSSEFLGSSTTVGFPENIYEILPCGPQPTTAIVNQGASIVTSFTFCISGNLSLGTAGPQLVYLASCLPHGQCSFNTTPLGGGVYQVSGTITTTYAGCFSPFGCEPAYPGIALLPGSWRWPPSGPWWPLGVFALATLLALRVAFLLARRRGRRLRLVYSAGLVLALALAGIWGCTSSPPVTPVGTYTIDITIKAGGFSLVVPVTVQVTQ